jgi:hypothetical protein
MILQIIKHNIFKLIKLDKQPKTENITIIFVNIDFSIKSYFLFLIINLKQINNITHSFIICLYLLVFDMTDFTIVPHKINGETYYTHSTWLSGRQRRAWFTIP